MKKINSFIIREDNSFINISFYAIKFIVVFLLSCSMSLFSVFLMVGYIRRALECATAIVSFFTSFAIIWKYYDNIISYLQKNKLAIAIFSSISLIIFYEYRKVYIASEFLKIKFDNINIIYFIIPALTTITVFFMSKAKEWFINFWNTLEKKEKIIHIALSIILLIIIVILYAKEPVFYQGYDTIYSLDSSWVYSNIYQKADYYDVRHPLMGIVTFPMYAVADFFFGEFSKIVVVHFINVQLLLLIGLILKKLSKNKYVYYIYLVSCPFIIFSLFFEKYVLCVFFIVVYLYNVFVKKENGNLLLTFIVGTMPTNAYVGILEFFRDKKFKEIILNVIKIGISFVLLFLMFGRIRFFTNGLSEIQKTRNNFSGNESTIIQRINSTSKMIEASIISLPSSKNGEEYLWNNVIDSPSYVSIGVIILMIIGLASKIKENNKIYLSFAISSAFSVVLFVVLNWAIIESPLFSICFSWAIIPLVCAGIDTIFSKINVKEKDKIYIYLPLVIIILVMNIYTIIDICRLY